jgi:signal transduction histidine kinase
MSHVETVDQAIIRWAAWDDAGAGKVIMEVGNPGPPIPFELLPRITDPFVSTKHSGTGLGLAIVRRLVQVQGGELTLASDEVKGTRARIIFPRLDPTTTSLLIGQG